MNKILLTLIFLLPILLFACGNEEKEITKFKFEKWHQDYFACNPFDTDSSMRFSIVDIKQIDEVAKYNQFASSYFIWDKLYKELEPFSEQCSDLDKRLEEMEDNLTTHFDIEKYIQDEILAKNHADFAFKNLDRFLLSSSAKKYLDIFARY